MPFYFHAFKYFSFQGTGVRQTEEIRDGGSCWSTWYQPYDFIILVIFGNHSAKNHDHNNFECFQASALVCCLWSALRQGQEDIAMEEAVMVMEAMLAMWAMKTTMTPMDMVMEVIVT